jgi:catechol 2,3-dioxygenase-like lactoylglutathione lyase family enzyme
MVEKLQMVSLIPVKQMPRAIAFYTKHLGARVVMRGDGPMKDWWAAVRLGGVDVWFVRAEGAEKRKLAYQTFVVKDIRKFVAGLKRRKVRFDRPERTNPATRIEGSIAFEPFGAAAFFHDTEGNLLMAWQNGGPGGAP